MLSVAEVCEMQPGDDQNATWINPGFRAEVMKVVHTTTKKAGKPMHICTLRGENGVGEISMTVFRPAIGFDEGDVIEVSGQGLRLTTYQGMLQATLGMKSEVHTVTAAATPPAARWTASAPVQQRAAAPVQQEERFEDAAPVGQRAAAPAHDVGTVPPERRRTATSTPGNPFAANGPRCGMVFELATAIIIHNAAHRPLVVIAGADRATAAGDQLVELSTLQHNLERIAATIMSAICRAEAGLVKLEDSGEEVRF